MKLMKLLRNQKGFTLIELVMIIIILGILGATVLIRIGGIQDSAEDAAIRGVYGHVVSAYGIAIASVRTNPSLSVVNARLGGDLGDLTYNGNPTITVISGGNTIAGKERQGTFDVTLTSGVVTDMGDLTLSDAP